MRVISVNVGRPQLLLRAGRQYSTAINKRPVEGPVELTATGLDGDRVSDQKVHGGPDKAICCYASEHYPYWNERLGRAIDVPAFGENFTLAGLVETQACIGDVLAVGTARVQVSQPRQPCSKLAAKHLEPRLIRWVNESGFTGFYVRVLQAGRVEAGDGLELLDRPHPDLTVERVTRVRLDGNADRHTVERLAMLAELSDSWRRHMGKLISGDLEDEE